MKNIVKSILLIVLGIILLSFGICLLSSAQTHTYNITGIIMTNEFGESVGMDNPENLKLDYDIDHTSLRLYGDAKMSFKLMELAEGFNVEVNAAVYVGYDSDRTICVVSINFADDDMIQVLVVYENESYIFIIGRPIKSTKKKINEIIV